LHHRYPYRKTPGAPELRSRFLKSDFRMRPDTSG
jgi:hypothetical protein